MESLENYISKHFVKERHGKRQYVRLDEVRRGKVKVTDVTQGTEHTETFTLPTPKFLKFYKAL